MLELEECEHTRERERFKDAKIPVLNIEEGVMSQGMQAVSRSWEGQGNRFSSKASRRNTALLTPGF